MAISRSWVQSANFPDCEFPILNLPCGVFSIRGGTRRCGVAIGDMILDVSGLEKQGLLLLAPSPLFNVPHWNGLMELGPEIWQLFRTYITDLLAEGAPEQEEVSRHLVPICEAELHMPFRVSEYTDFNSGKHHALNAGEILRGVKNTLHPNWLSMPVAYNGRASSVVVSGTNITRPYGQLKSADSELPILAPSQKFDFELELGTVIGVGSSGMISPEEAEANIFGFVLLNDWSARDVQSWESTPLGPFLSKATATTISPWIVMRAALEPFQVEAPKRERPLLPYLKDRKSLSYNILVFASLKPEGGDEVRITQTSTRELYYSPTQQLCHHTVSGCSMRIGDLLGSGTISGAERNQLGSLLEISKGGTEPLKLPGGVSRTFLDDGDTLKLSGYAQGEGYRVGFGDCTGSILPAPQLPEWAQCYPNNVPDGVCK